MKLVRPYIPLDVRLQVIARQLQADGDLQFLLLLEMFDKKKPERLAHLLVRKFGDQKVHLDHDPPLCLRARDDETGEYDPPANDPRFLVYRTEQDHKIKTFIRGDGAQLSDAGKRRKEIKRQRKLEPSRKRSWPPGRKLRSRPMGAAR